MNKKSKVFQIAVSAILVVAVVFCITVIAQVMSEGYVNIFGRSFFRIVTGSMEPTIPEGALIITKQEDIENIEVGDIICFRSQESTMLGQSITHRVIDIKTSSEGKIYLQTRGDANSAADGYYVTQSNLIGEVVFYTKSGNVVANLFSYLTTKMGFMTCIVFPVLLIAGLIMRSSLKSIQQELAMLEQEEQRIEAKQPEIEETMTPEEYEAMVERLKREIMEEVKQSVEQEQTEPESGQDTEC